MPRMSHEHGEDAAARRGLAPLDVAPNRPRSDKALPPLRLGFACPAQQERGDSEAYTGTFSVAAPPPMCQQASGEVPGEPEPSTAEVR